METLRQLHFSTSINASRGKVWDVLWNENTYSIWTGAFSEGSYAVSKWDEGGKIQFLSTLGDGMYSTIIKIIPNQEMTFQHIGVIKNFEEMEPDDETRKWSGSQEKYILKQEGELTILEVFIGVTEDFEDYFNGSFPKALARVKSLAEEERVSN